GQLDRSRDPVGNWTTNSYTEKGLLSSLLGNYGQTLALSYDTRDRATQVTDANGITTTNSFDDLDRLLTRAYPSNAFEGFLYSANGLVGYTNQIGKETRYGRDAAGRLLSTTNANLAESYLTYSSAGDLVALQDGNQHTARWFFDIYGRLTAKTNGLGHQIAAYQYNANGWLTSRVDGASQQTFYLRDAVGNATSVVYPSHTESFTFD